MTEGLGSEGSEWSRGRTKTKSDSKFFVFLTCIYVITWYLQLSSRIGLLQAVRFEFVLGLFLSICAIFQILKETRPATSLRLPVTLWLILLAVYSLFSYDFEKSWDIYFNRVIKFSMLALFIVAFVRTEWALRCVIFAFLLAMLKMGQEGVIGWLGGGLVWQNQGIMRLHGSTMLYRHPNSFSGMAVGCLPFIFFLFPVVGRFVKLGLIGLLISCIVIIIFTGSRTGYVATLLLCSYFWWGKLKQSWLKYSVIGLALLFVLLPFVPEQYVGRFESIFTMEEAEARQPAPVFKYW